MQLRPKLRRLSRSNTTAFVATPLQALNALEFILLEGGSGTIIICENKFQRVGKIIRKIRLKDNKFGLIFMHHMQLSSKLNFLGFKLSGPAVRAYYDILLFFRVCIELSLGKTVAVGFYSWPMRLALRVPIISKRLTYLEDGLGVADLYLSRKERRYFGLLFNLLPRKTNLHPHRFSRVLRHTQIAETIHINCLNAENRTALLLPPLRVLRRKKVEGDEHDPLRSLADKTGPVDVYFHPRDREIEKRLPHGWVAKQNVSGIPLELFVAADAFPYQQVIVLDSTFMYSSIVLSERIRVTNLLFRDVPCAPYVAFVRAQLSPSGRYTQMFV